MTQNSYAITTETYKLGKWRKINELKAYNLRKLAQPVLSGEHALPKPDSTTAQPSTTELVHLRNAAAQQALAELHDLLSTALQRNPVINWCSLKVSIPEQAAKPLLPVLEKPTLFKLPPRPTLAAAPQRDQFQTPPTLLTKWLKPMQIKQAQLAEAAYQQALHHYQTEHEQVLQRWQVRYQQIEAQNAKVLERYSKRAQAAQLEYANALKQWTAAQHIDTAQLMNINAQIDAYQAAYERHEPAAILDYCEMVLSESPYPASLAKHFALSYQAEQRLLIVNYRLPLLAQMPSLYKVSRIKQSNLVREIYLSDRQIKQLYEETLYQIVLRSLYELFTADTINALEHIVFNGRLTQPQDDLCILHLNTSKAAFTEVDLASLEPKTAFEQLHGISCQPLSAMSAIDAVISADLSHQTGSAQEASTG